MKLEDGIRQCDCIKIWHREDRELVSILPIQIEGTELNRFQVKVREILEEIREDFLHFDESEVHTYSVRFYLYGQRMGRAVVSSVQVESILSVVDEDTGIPEDVDNDPPIMSARMRESKKSVSDDELLKRISDRRFATSVECFRNPEDRLRKPETIVDPYHPITTCDGCREITDVSYHPIARYCLKCRNKAVSALASSTSSSPTADPLLCENCSRGSHYPCSCLCGCRICAGLRYNGDASTSASASADPHPNSSRSESLLDENGLWKPLPSEVLPEAGSSPPGPNSPEASPRP